MIALKFFAPLVGLVVCAPPALLTLLCSQGHHGRLGRGLGEFVLAPRPVAGSFLPSVVALRSCDMVTVLLTEEVRRISLFCSYSACIFSFPFSTSLSLHIHATPVAVLLDSSSFLRMQVLHEQRLERRTVIPAARATSTSRITPCHPDTEAAPGSCLWSSSPGLSGVYTPGEEPPLVQVKVIYTGRFTVCRRRKDSDV